MKAEAIELDPDFIPWYAKNVANFHKKQDVKRLAAWIEELMVNNAKIKQLVK